MTEDIKTEAEIAEKLVAESTTPDEFNFAAAVLDRAYPEIKVPIYLNEKNVLRLITAIEERDALLERVAKLGDNHPSAEDWADRLQVLDDEFTSAHDALKAEEYIVTIKGVSPEEREKIEKEAHEAFPLEYDESTHPLTGNKIKTEIPNDARDELAATLIRRAHLVSVQSPTGAIDSDFSTVDKVRIVISGLPLIARVKIDEAIKQSTLAVDYYRELVDEVF